MGIDPDYVGREQALVKHELLSSYLEVLCMIVGKWSNEIVYVDCFAGPWFADDESVAEQGAMDKTSIAKSIDILERSQDALRDQFGRDVRFRALYIERDSDAFSRLTTYLSQRKSPVKTHAFYGNFVDLIPKILAWAGSSSFAFFFVDPKGYKDICPGVMQPLLERKKSELLINYMYEFANRDKPEVHGDDKHRCLYGQILDLAGLPPEAREEKQLRGYLEFCKQHVAVPLYTGSMRVRIPGQTRTKYHLVYITKEPLGLIKFLEQSEKVVDQQERIRVEVLVQKRARQHQIADLFAAVDEHQIHPDTQGSAIPVARDYWINKLENGPLTVSRTAFARVLDETLLLPRDLQAALGELIKEGVVENVDAPRANRRSKHFVHYDKSEVLRLLPRRFE